VGERDAVAWGRQCGGNDVHSEHAGEGVEGQFIGAATPVCISVVCLCVSLSVCERDGCLLVPSVHIAAACVGCVALAVAVAELSVYFVAVRPVVSSKISCLSFALSFR
jgi:hypothetical protein